jgi:hypothetical protein
MRLYFVIWVTVMPPWRAICSRIQNEMRCFSKCLIVAKFIAEYIIILDYTGRPDQRCSRYTVGRWNTWSVPSNMASKHSLPPLHLPRVGARGKKAKPWIRGNRIDGFQDGYPYQTPLKTRSWLGQTIITSNTEV